MAKQKDAEETEKSGIAKTIRHVFATGLAFVTNFSSAAINPAPPQRPTAPPQPEPATQLAPVKDGPFSPLEMQIGSAQAAPSLSTESVKAPPSMSIADVKKSAPLPTMEPIKLDYITNTKLTQKLVEQEAHHALESAQNKTPPLPFKAMETTDTKTAKRGIYVEDPPAYAHRHHHPNQSLMDEYAASGLSTDMSSHPVAESIFAHYRDRADIEEIRAAFVSAAHKNEVSLDHMATVAVLESNMKPDCHDGGSQYHGIFQLSYQQMKEGSHTSAWKGDPYDVWEAAERMAEITRENSIAYRKSHNGQDPTPEMSYDMHQQGRSGAIAMENKPNELAWKTLLAFDSEFKAKQSIEGNLWDKSIDPLKVTGGEFLASWDHRYDMVISGAFFEKNKMEFETAERSRSARPTASREQHSSHHKKYPQSVTATPQNPSYSHHTGIPSSEHRETQQRHRTQPKPVEKATPTYRTIPVAQPETSHPQTVIAEPKPSPRQIPSEALPFPVQKNTQPSSQPPDQDHTTHQIGNIKVTVPPLPQPLGQEKPSLAEKLRQERNRRNNEQER